MLPGLVVASEAKTYFGETALSLAEGDGIQENSGI